MSDLTPQELHILQHSLGLTRGTEIYRNHFVTGPGENDFEHCCSLVDKGYMTKQRSSLLHEHDRVFSVTEEGKRMVLEMRGNAG